MKNIICIEGTKGAGKSTTINNIKKKLGDKVVIKAPFYDVRENLLSLTGCKDTFVASQNKEYAVIANDLLTSCIKQAIKEKKEDEILVFDRGWLTGLCTVIGSVLNENEKQVEISKWQELLIPTVFIHTSPQNTLRVRKEELSFDCGLADQKMVEEDYSLRLALAKKYKNTILYMHETYPFANDLEKQKSQVLSIVLNKIKQNY